MQANTEIKEEWREVENTTEWSTYFRYFQWSVPAYWYVDKKGVRHEVKPCTRYKREAREGYEFLQNNHGDLKQIQELCKK